MGAADGGDDFDVAHASASPEMRRAFQAIEGVSQNTWIWKRSSSSDAGVTTNTDSRITKSIGGHASLDRVMHTLIV